MYFICLHKYMIFFSFSFCLASRIRYEITSGNIGGAFAVKNMTGAIYVAGALDYETRKRVSTYLEPPTIVVHKYVKILSSIPQPNQHCAHVKQIEICCFKTFFLYKMQNFNLHKMLNLPLLK